MQLRKATLNDRAALQAICRETYSQIFADHWTEDGLEVYLTDQFGTERLNRELIDPLIDYFFIELDGQIIGFIKLNHHSDASQSTLDNCELEKIYILPKFGGRGLGKQSMQHILDTLRRKGKQELNLCVIDTNENAIAYYQKLGFEIHSTTRLNALYFREELRGMFRMRLTL